MSEPFLGEIMANGYTFAPRSWAACDGQLLPINTNTALFSLLGTNFGGDGRSTFALPDLRGRVMIHRGAGPGLSTRNLGQKSGQESVTLSVQQLPQHNHPVGNIMASTVTGNAQAPSSRKNVLSASSAGDIYGSTPPDIALNTSGGTGGNSGGGLAHNNMPPYLVVNVCIALQGLYPSRN